MVEMAAEAAAAAAKGEGGLENFTSAAVARVEMEQREALVPVVAPVAGQAAERLGKVVGLLMVEKATQAAYSVRMEQTVAAPARDERVQISAATATIAGKEMHQVEEEAMAHP